MHREGWVLLSRNDCQPSPVQSSLPQEGIPRMLLRFLKLNVWTPPVETINLSLFFAGADHRRWRRRRGTGSGEESSGGICGPVWDRRGGSDSTDSDRRFSKVLMSVSSSLCRCVASSVGRHQRIQEVPPRSGQRVLQSQTHPPYWRRLWIHEAEPGCLRHHYNWFLRPSW